MFSFELRRLIVDGEHKCVDYFLDQSISCGL